MFIKALFHASILVSLFFQVHAMVRSSDKTDLLLVEQQILDEKVPSLFNWSSCVSYAKKNVYQDFLAQLILTDADRTRYYELATKISNHVAGGTDMPHIYVSGLAGMGKSRFAQELCTFLGIDSIRIDTGVCDRMLSSSNLFRLESGCLFLMLADVLKFACHYQGKLIIFIDDAHDFFGPMPHQHRVLIEKGKGQHVYEAKPCDAASCPVLEHIARWLQKNAAQCICLVASRNASLPAAFISSFKENIVVTAPQVHVRRSMILSLLSAINAAKRPSTAISAWYNYMVGTVIPETRFTPDALELLTEKSEGFSPDQIRLMVQQILSDNQNVPVVSKALIEARVNRNVQEEAQEIENKKS